MSAAPIKKLRLKKPESVPAAPIRKPKVKDKAPEPPKPYTIPGFPIETGPIKYNEREVFALTGSDPFVITLDRGTFQYVWEMLEARARIDHQKYHMMPNVRRVTEESVRSFRNTAKHTLGADEVVKKKLKLKGVK